VIEGTTNFGGSDGAIWFRRGCCELGFQVVVRWSKGGWPSQLEGGGILASEFRLLAGLVRKGPVKYRIAAFCTVCKRENCECGASP